MGKKKRAKENQGALFADPTPGTLSVSDPALAEFFGFNWLNGTAVSESQSLGLTAVYRAVALISGTIAALPLRVYEGTGATRRQVEGHWLTVSPAGPYDLSPFSFVETLLLHLLLHGEGYLKSISNYGGEVVGLWPVHPNAVSEVRWDGADKMFRVNMADGTQEVLYTGSLTQVLGPSTDGLRGISPIALFSQPLQTMRSSERAANRAMTSGALIGGLVTTEEDIDETEAKAIKASLNAKMNGAEHAGDIAFINRSLKFNPWSMSMVDQQFIEQRRFGVEEAARIYGLPLNLLSVANVTSNWGTGVAEANLGLQKYVLMGWTSRVESAMRQVLPPGQFAEFDYAGLLAGSPKDEIGLLIEQVKSGLLTRDEARAIRNLPPLTDAQRAEMTPPTPSTPPEAPMMQENQHGL